MIDPATSPRKRSCRIACLAQTVQGITHGYEGRTDLYQSVYCALACGDRVSRHCQLSDCSIDFQPAVVEQIFNLSMSVDVLRRVLSCALVVTHRFELREFGFPISQRAHRHLNEITYFPYAVEFFAEFFFQIHDVRWCN